jgi:hypothetical protein
MTRHRNNHAQRKKTKQPEQDTKGLMDPQNLRILPNGDFCFLNPEVVLEDGKKVEIVCNSFGATNAQIEATVIR